MKPLQNIHTGIVLMGEEVDVVTAEPYNIGAIPGWIYNAGFHKVMCVKVFSVSIVFFQKPKSSVECKVRICFDIKLKVGLS